MDDAEYGIMSIYIVSLSKFWVKYHGCASDRTS